MEKSQEEQQLEQIRTCTEVGQRCLEYDRAKRTNAQGITDERTESKERCIGTQTGAGSSTEQQSSSLVENKNEPTRRRFRVEAFKYKGPIDPKIVPKTCKAVTQAISEMYDQGRTDMIFADLYRDAYNMVLHNKAEELYSAVETALTSGMQSLFRPLDAAPADGGAWFLQELLAKWNQHLSAIKVTRDVVMYMDRTFVPTHRKTPIKELGLRLWRDHMVGSDNIRERLVEAVKQCSGDGGEDELVAGVKEMLKELGADVPCLLFPDGELDVAGP